MNKITNPISIATRRVAHAVVIIFQKESKLFQREEQVMVKIKL